MWSQSLSDAAVNKRIWQPGEKYLEEIKYKTDINDANQIHQTLLQLQHLILSKRTCPNLFRSAKSCTGLDLLIVWITLTAAVDQTWLPLHLGNQKGFTQSSWSRSDHNYFQACHFQAAEISYLTKKLNMLQLTGKLVCPVFF